MRLAFGKSWGPIGIDIGARCIKALQLSRTRKGWRVEAATVFAQPQANAPIDRLAARRIAGVLERQGFRGRDVVLAVPPTKLEVGILELPPRDSGAPIEQIARTELARTAKVAVETLAVDMWDVPAPARATGATHVMAVALRHHDADALVDALEGEGLNLRSLDIHAWALARASSPQAKGTAGVTAVLDIGWNGALLVLVHQGQVIYQRALTECGIEAIRKNIAQALELEDLLADHILDQIVLQPGTDGDRTDPMLWASIRSLLGEYVSSLSTELLASFSYASHRYPANAVDKLFLTGGGASIANLPESLSERLGVSVKTLAPAELVECSEAMLTTCSVPALTGALGLAQYGEGQ